MKHSVIFILIFLLSLVTTICHAQITTLHPALNDFSILQWHQDDCGDNNPDVILCLGDSITSGEYVSYKKRYPTVLKKLTQKDVVNQAQSGSRTSYGIEYISKYLDWYKPRIVTILYGVNDIGERSVEDIANNLRQIVDIVKDNNSFPILATLTPIFWPRDWKASSVAELNVMIREIVRKQGIQLADLEQAFNWDYRYFPDGLHPNEAGMQIIADTFNQAIRKVPACRSGSLMVNIEPDNASNMGAMWRRINTKTWHNSGYQETNILTGPYIVEFKDVSGWIKPPDKNVTVSKNQTATVTGVYRSKSLPGVIMLLLDGW